MLVIEGDHIHTLGKIQNCFEVGVVTNCGGC
jgi:hypothetical protein